ncbi:flagellin [Luminiphilus sp.]|jgi:flagellin|nr:flagellin [Luminiphilus sp.]MEC8111386.1 flagellin [Pseudomonadota bacterium]
MAVVNTNVNATVAQNALVRNERQMNTAMERLSTGQRINGAKDDAAGLAISSRMTSQIRGLEVGIRNANDAISMISTADGALIEVTNMLQRMRELALQSANGTTTSSDRDYLNSEYQKLISEIDRIAQNTQWNGGSILNHTTTASSTFKYQVGANGGQTIAVDFGDFNNTGASGVMQNLNSANGSIAAGTTASAMTTASAAVTSIDSAITAVNTQRATFGAAVNQLTYAVDNLASVKVNAEASRSRILDTDYAAETSELARTQIIQQAGTAMLAQANQLPQTVLSLLQ